MNKRKTDDYDYKAIQAQNIASVQAELAKAEAKEHRDKFRAQRTAFLISLIQARHYQKLSQTELAARAGMPQSTIARVESGTGNPSLNTLLRIAEVLKVNIMIE